MFGHFTAFYMKGLKRKRKEKNFFLKVQNWLIAAVLRSRQMKLYEKVHEKYLKRSSFKVKYQKRTRKSV